VPGTSARQIVGFILPRQPPLSNCGDRLREQVRPGLRERQIPSGRMLGQPAMRDCGGDRRAVTSQYARNEREAGETVDCRIEHGIHAAHDSE
jgi:hypothetical protein